MNYELPDDPNMEEPDGPARRYYPVGVNLVKRTPSITEIATALALAAARNGHAVEKADYCFNGDWDLPVGDYDYARLKLGRSLTTPEHMKLRREYERLVRLAFATCEALHAIDAADPNNPKDIEGDAPWAELVAEDEARIERETLIINRIPALERRKIY